MNYEEIAPFVKEGKIAWTMTTNGYKFYTLNLIKSLREVAKVPWNLCVICFDIECFLFFRRERIPSVLWRKGGKSQVIAAAFGTEDFSRLNKIKVELLLWFSVCKEIRETMYIDGDIVIRRDPFVVLEDIVGGAQKILFQCDCATMEDHSGCGNACTGFIVERKSPAGESLLSKVYEFDSADWDSADKQDQPYVGNRMKKFGVPYDTLPRHLFGNGTWQKSGAWKKDSSWVLLHYNHRIGAGKKAAMKNDGHWRLPY